MRGSWLQAYSTVVWNPSITNPWNIQGSLKHRKKTPRVWLTTITSQFSGWCSCTRVHRFEWSLVLPVLCKLQQQARLQIRPIPMPRKWTHLQNEIWIYKLYQCICYIFPRERNQKRMKPLVASHTQKMTRVWHDHANHTRHKKLILLYRRLAASAALWALNLPSSQLSAHHHQSKIMKQMTGTATTTHILLLLQANHGFAAGSWTLVQQQRPVQPAYNRQ